MANKSFSEFNTTTSVGASDLVLVSKNLDDGYDTRNVNVQTLANSLNNQLTMASLDTEDKTIVGAVNEIKGTVDSLDGVEVKNLTVLDANVDRRGILSEVISGNVHFVHIAFKALNNIPINTDLIQGEVHSIGMSNIAFYNVTGTRVVPFAFKADGKIANSSAITQGDEFCIDMVLV